MPKSAAIRDRVVFHRIPESTKLLKDVAVMTGYYGDKAGWDNLGVETEVQT